MNLPTINNLTIKNKRIFLRADLNIPLKNKKILNDYKIKALLPTIDFIQSSGGKIILATHMARPDAHERTNFYEKDLSTKIISEWFTKNGYAIDYEMDLRKAAKKSLQQNNEILLIENLRFFNGEQGTSTEQHALSEILLLLADAYVNDAFGLIHRNDTSITLLATLFKPQNRAIGLLIEKEAKHLTRLKNNPYQPFLFLLGGGKIKGKTPMLAKFIKTIELNRVATIAIGGAIAHAFLKATGIHIGKSLIDETSIPQAAKLLYLAEKNSVNILLPQDVLVQTTPPTTAPPAPPTIHSIDSIPSDGIIIDIGPKTIENYKKSISQAKTIFTNGTMGIYENTKSQRGTKETLKAIASNTSAYTIAGGGDAIAAIHMFKLEDKFDFLSTGGGAAMAFLGTENPEKEFPALKALS